MSLHEICHALDPAEPPVDAVAWTIFPEALCGSVSRPVNESVIVAR